MTPISLCRSCFHVRPVQGRLGQAYLLCRNEAVDVKYPPQPVVRCAGYAPGGTGGTAATGTGSGHA